MTATIPVEQSPIAKRPRRRIGRAAVLLVGVAVVPVILSLAFNSYGALTVESALRMAATTVAGQTIAILSAIAAVVLTVKRRYAWPSILVFVIIAVAITSWALGSMVSAGDLLLDRLDLIAEVDQLNR